MIFNGKIFPPISLLVILMLLLVDNCWLISPTETLSEPNNRSKNLEDTLSIELNRLKIKNEHQDREISILGSRVEKQNDEMNHLKAKNVQILELVDQLSRKLASLEASPSPNIHRHYISHQEKSLEERRISRSLDDDEDDTSSKKSEQFATEKWPANCQELKNLGHSLNGLYLVKDAKAEATKIQTVYCTFQKSDPNVMEERVGFVDVKSSAGGIHFHVERDPKPKNRTIPTVVKYRENGGLNLGGAMDVSTGVFTAPKPGVYQFAFYGLKNGIELGGFKTHLRLNGVKKAGLPNFVIGIHTYPMVIRSTLKLKRGDRVDIFHESGLYSDHFATHFTGSLLDEDILSS